MLVSRVRVRLDQRTRPTRERKRVAGEAGKAGMKSTLKLKSFLKGSAKLLWILGLTFGANGIRSLAGPSPRIPAQVAFLKVLDTHGNPYDLEPNDAPLNLPIGHVAIRWLTEKPGRWLHAHPRGGVQWSESLERFGKVIDILAFEALDPINYNHWVGRPYDPLFRWGEAEFYCSELVGRVVNDVLPFPPSWMRFEGDYWRRYFEQLGVPPPQDIGYSPKAVYRALQGLQAQSIQHRPLLDNTGIPGRR